MLKLIADNVGCKVVFEVENAPRAPGADVRFSSRDQDRVGNNGYPNRFTDPSHLFGDLALTQSQAAFDLFEKNLDKPFPLVNAKHMCCRQFHLSISRNS